jgi:hypothetical protein
MSNKYQNLEELLGCYFHQDWTSDDDSAPAVVERYLSEWPSDGVLAVVDEIGQLLREIKSEDDLRKVVMKLGCYYEPGADALTYREWLASVSERLAAG